MEKLVIEAAEGVDPCGLDCRRGRFYPVLRGSGVTDFHGSGYATPEEAVAAGERGVDLMVANALQWSPVAQGREVAA